MPDRGGALGEALCADPRVRKISFTGSTGVGEPIARVAGVKKLSLELGASCPVVVLPDADLEARPAIAAGGFANAGQVCISVQRVIVERGGQWRLPRRPGAAGRGHRRSTPRARTPAIGILISEAEARRVGRRSATPSRRRPAVTGGGRDGAHDARGGRRRRPAGSARTSCSARPSPYPRPRTAESDRQANDTRYGLGAGVFTSDVAGARARHREIDAGNVYINRTPLWRADLMPYGGLKGSGIGMEGHALRGRGDDRGEDRHPARALRCDARGRAHLTGRPTTRLTSAQALVRSSKQSASATASGAADPGVGIFGHGNVAGLGQALDEYGAECLHPGPQRAVAGAHRRRLRQGHAAARRARRHGVDRPRRDQHGHRRGLATVNRLPVLLLPADNYVTRRQGPVLQQLEHPI